MTRIQQQRLIGVLLLLCVICTIAFFLLTSVHQSLPVKEQNPEPIKFNSIIEPLDDSKIEVVKQPEPETLIDPQSLGKPAPNQGLQAAIKPAVKQAAPAAIKPVVKQAAPAPIKPVVKQAAPAPIKPVVKQAAPAPIKPAVKKAAPTPIKPKTKTLATTNTKQTWVVQLASFSVKDNAIALKTQVEKMGYKPVIEAVSSNKNTIYRVRLLPISAKDKAQEIATKLGQKLRLNSKVFLNQP